MTPYTIQAILDSDPDRIGELKNKVISPNMFIVHTFKEFDLINLYFSCTDTAAIESPKISNSIYVDSVNGRDWKNGQSESTAVQTLQKAVQILENGTQILLKNGIYKNKNFGSGELNNPTVMNIIDKNNILITSFPGKSILLNTKVFVNTSV